MAMEDEPLWVRELAEKQPPYAGKDPNLVDVSVCFNCECDDRFGPWRTLGQPREPDAALSKCARCKFALYCSQKCQQADFPEHKEFCKQVDKLTKQLAKLERDLNERDDDFFFTARPFDNAVGHFWGILDTRDYCRKRHELALELYHAAYEKEQLPAWEMVLGHMLGLLRLNKSDNIGIRSCVPWVLLYMNRDQDCYSFIKWWLHHINLDIVNEEWPDGTQDGDWLYPAGDSAPSMLEDILDEFPSFREFPNMDFLASVVLIKMRMVSEYEGRLASFDVFAATDRGRRDTPSPPLLSPSSASSSSSSSSQQQQQQQQQQDPPFCVLSPELLGQVREMLCGTEAHTRVMQQQEDHAMDYLRALHKHNPTLLPALVNPGPLRSKEPPATYTQGSPAEAYFVLNRCCRHFGRLPAVMRRIKSIVGEDPVYDTEFDDGDYGW